MENEITVSVFFGFISSVLLGGSRLLYTATAHRL
jgi:hypothetical protein